MKDVIGYTHIDPSILPKILDKMKNHLWYLSDETIAFAFFDPTVSVDEKKRMANNLHSEEPRVILFDGRETNQPHTCMNLSLRDFVSVVTQNFFKRFNISAEFTKSDPCTWEANAEFQRGSVIRNELLVVNDVAAR